MDQDTNKNNQNETKINPQPSFSASQEMPEDPPSVADYLNADIKDVRKNELEKTDIADYHDIPFYRRTWFIGLTFLFFTPATVLIILTGDVYRLNRKDKTVNRWSQQSKTGMLLVTLFVFIYGLINLLSR